LKEKIFLKINVDLNFEVFNKDNKKLNINLLI
jgi:hypothetical protein